MAKKASTNKSTGKRPPLAAFLNANSKGDDHAEYTTNITRNVCHILTKKLKKMVKSDYFFNFKKHLLDVFK